MISFRSKDEKRLSEDVALEKEAKKSEQAMKLSGERTFQAQRRTDVSNLVLGSWRDVLKGQ